MKKCLLTFASILLFSTVCVNAQIGVVSDRAYVMDTLRTNSLSAGLSFMFYFADDEMSDYTTFRFLNSGHVTYVFNLADIEVGMRQLVEQNSDGDWGTDHFILLSSGIMKYKPIGEGLTDLQKFYVEPLAIYQNNTKRGLRRRFQVGALMHPWGIIHRKFNLNVGLGIVRDWSSWEVNDPQEIADASPELRRKIEFVNARIKMRKGKYQDHSEWRPMVMLTLNWRVNQLITLNLTSSYQQSLKSPYNNEIRDEYPYMGNVYPYILTQLDLNVRLFKGFSMSIASNVDYENSNLSLYKSSWAYNMLVGFSWAFTNQNPR